MIEIKRTFAFAFAVYLSSVPAFAQSSGNAESGAVDQKLETRAPNLTDLVALVPTSLQLNASAREAAKLIGAVDYIEALPAAAGEAQRTKDAAAIRRVVATKFLIFRKMWMAHLEVCDAAARVDRELAYNYDVAAELLAKRSKAIKLTNTANFMQGGILSSCRLGILMNSKVPIATLDTSNYIRIVTSSTGVALALTSLAESKMGHRVSDRDPNTLAGFFSLENAKPYWMDGTIWNFINNVPPGGRETRRETLLKRWKRLNHFEDKNSRKVRMVAGVANDDSEKNESIDLITKRIFLLHDVHALAEDLNAELYELQKSITSTMPPPVVSLSPSLDLKTISSSLAETSGTDASSQSDEIIISEIEKGEKL